MNSCQEKCDRNFSYGQIEGQTHKSKIVHTLLLWSGGIIKWYFITYHIFYRMIQYCNIWDDNVSHVMYHMIQFLNIQNIASYILYDMIVSWYNMIHHCIISLDTKSYETLLYSVVYSNYLSLYKQIVNICDINWSINIELSIFLLTLIC